MLKNGRIFASGGKEVLTQENIREVYGIDVEIIEGNGKKVVAVMC